MTGGMHCAHVQFVRFVGRAASPGRVAYESSCRGHDISLPIGCQSDDTEEMIA